MSGNNITDDTKASTASVVTRFSGGTCLNGPPPKPSGTCIGQCTGTKQLCRTSDHAMAYNTCQAGHIHCFAIRSSTFSLAFDVRCQPCFDCCTTVRTHAVL
eukprot:1022391-Amphidinium_carterae.1